VSVKALGTEGFRRAESGERSAHNHDAPAVLESGPRSVAMHVAPRCACGAPLCLFDEDSLHRTRRRRAQHLLPLRFVRGWIVKERFLSMQLEDAGGQETTLGVGLTAIQINDDAHLYTSRLLRRML
jgi:hypothetical protein